MKFLIVMTIIGWAYSKTIVDCPSGCKCDKIMNWRRVKCIDQNFLNIGDDIPLHVEILDISYNQISELFQDEFLNLGLTSIRSLNISHNKMRSMHLNAFKGLNKIRTLDLSFNVIEFILQEWFVDLPNLKELYMNNNNFFKLQAKGPLIVSKKLEILDISNCKLTQLTVDSFSELPKLETLRVDGNFLIEISPSIIKPLKNLRVLSVADNPFNCGKVMNELKRFTKGKIKYVDPCSSPKLKDVEKSQKMITLEEKPTQDHDMWMYDDDDDDDEESQVQDNISFCNCTKFNHESEGLLLEIIRLSPVLSLVITLITGFMLGLIIACSVQITPSKASSVQRRPKRYSIIRRTYIENNDPLVLNCENVFESTPITPRRIEMYPLR